MLSSIRALVTRPFEQANELVRKIEALNGTARALPMIEIAPLPEDQAMRPKVLQLDHYQKVIAVSHHAARLGMAYIKNYWPQLPVNIGWYAIGEKTRKVLSHFDVSAFCPERPLDSETLLALTYFEHIQGKNILLLKGRGGRNLLQKELQTRGAQVDTLETYERKRPAYQAHQVQKELKQHGINVMLVSSGEILTNLTHYLLSAPVPGLTSQQTSECLSTSLVVPSQRVAQQARLMGFKRIYTAQGATDSAMLSALSLINSEE